MTENMCIRQFVKYGFAGVLLLMSISTVQAGAYGSGGTRHYIGVSVAGAEANLLAPKTDIRTRIGGGANGMLNYELHHHGFIFSLGLKAQYQYTCNTLDQYVDAFDRMDRNGQAVQYQYVYSGWKENNSDIRLTVPVQFGYEYEQYFYGLLGAQFSLSMSDMRATTATMHTQGLYAWSIEPILTSAVNDFTSFGFYPEAQYASAGSVSERQWVSVSLELGSYIPLSTRRVRLRAGLYADYAFRLGKKENRSLCDYSKVDANPRTQNQPDLQANLYQQSIFDSNLIKSSVGNMEIGVRFTALIDVTITTKRCMCANDNDY